MLIKSTVKVTPEHGPRPAGKPDQCFYCRAPMGSDHALDCVLRVKTVVIRATFEMVIAVPDEWDEETINFCRNEGSWCVDNLVDHMADFIERSREGDGGCFCGSTKIQYLRDATRPDMDNLPIAVSKDNAALIAAEGERGE